MTSEHVPRDGEPVRASGVQRFLPIALVAACIAFGYAMGWHRYLSMDYLSDSSDLLKRWAADNPVLAPLTFILIYTLGVVLAIPAKFALTIFGSFLFGFAPGVAYALFAAVAGATAVFLALRTAFGGFLRRRAGSRAAVLAAGFRENAFLYLLALRLATVIPSSVINLACALFDVRLRTFIAATMIGITPATCVYAWLGQGLDSALVAARMEGRHLTPYDLLTPQITLAFAAISLLALLPTIVKKVRGRT